MIKRANPTLIGAFVVGALALVIAAVIIFGKDNLFSEPRRFVVVFDSNVQGLRVGAPVTLQGVQVGSVADMQLLIEKSEDSVLVPVVIQIYPQHINVLGAENRWHLSDDKIADILVSKGLRAQLQMQSFVTGQLVVELQFHPGSEPVFRDQQGNYPEIPSVPKSVDEISNTISELVAQVQQVPIKKIADELLLTLESAHALLDKPELTQSIDRINELAGSLQQTADTLNRSLPQITNDVADAVADTRRMANNLDRELPKVGKRVMTSLDQLDRTLVSAEVSLQQVADMTAEDSALNYSLLSALKEVKLAARSLRTTADYIQQHPESLLTGKQSSSQSLNP